MAYNTLHVVFSNLPSLRCIGLKVTVTCCANLVLVSKLHCSDVTKAAPNQKTVLAKQRTQQACRGVVSEAAQVCSGTLWRLLHMSRTGPAL